MGRFNGTVPVISILMVYGLSEIRDLISEKRA
jgi:hypothetical protein